MISKESKLHFDYDKYVVESQNSRNLLVDNISYTMITMNETANNILKLLNGSNTVEEVIKSISAMYYLPETVVEDYILKFLEKMHNDELIHDVNIASKDKDYQTLSRLYISLTEMDGNGKCKELPLKQVKELIESIEKYTDPQKVVVHLIGEPLRHSKWKKIVEYLIDIPYIKIWLYCNNVVLSESILSYMKGKIDIILFDLFHYNEIKNDEMSVHEHFKNFERNVKLCMENNILCYARMTPKLENVNALAEIHQFVYNLGLKGLLINSLDKRELINQGKDVKQFEDEYEKQFVKIATNNDFINSWRNNRIQPNTDAFILITEDDLCFRGIYSLNRRKHCGLGQEEMSIDAYGNIYPCHKLHFDKYVCSKTEEFFKNKDKLYGDNIINDKCKQCNVWMLCLGGCRAENYLANVNLSNPRKDCDKRKISVKKYLFETKDVI